MYIVCIIALGSITSGVNPTRAVRAVPSRLSSRTVCDAATAQSPSPRPISGPRMGARSLLAQDSEAYNMLFRAWRNPPE